jgi:hypothetical protein
LLIYLLFLLAARLPRDAQNATDPPAFGPWSNHCQNLCCGATGIRAGPHAFVVFSALCRGDPASAHAVQGLKPDVVGRTLKKQMPGRRIGVPENEGERPPAGDSPYSLFSAVPV